MQIPQLNRQVQLRAKLEKRGVYFAAGLGRPRAEHGGERQNRRGVATPSSRPLRFSPPPRFGKKKTTREEMGEGRTGGEAAAAAAGEEL